MTIQITDSQMLSIRRHSMPVLRKLGINNNHKPFESHKFEWKDLSERVKAARKAGGDLIDQLEGASEERAEQIQEAFDGIKAIHDDLENERDIRMNLGSRAPRSTEGDPRRPLGDDLSVNGGADGAAVAELSSVGLRREDRIADHVRSEGAAQFDLTPGALLRAMVLGAKTEPERRALTEGTDSAGGFTVPDILSAEWIDLMRARTAVIRAGARTVLLTSDTTHVAKVASDPVPAWRNEGASVAESDPTFARVTFTPQSMAVQVKVSRELLEDSLNIETALPDILAAAMAVELDRVAMFGTGTAPEPEGIVNFTGVTEDAHDAALTNYAPLVSARTTIKTNNHDGVSAYVMAPRDEGKLAGLTATDNQPLRVPPAIADIPILTTTSVPINEGVGSNESTIIAGDFSRLLIGLRHVVMIQILKERYQDTGHYGFIAFMRADVAAEHENAFVKITGITP